MAAGMKRLRTSEEDAERVRTEKGSNLLLDLRKTLNAPESSDVTFVCKDGKKVYACRWFLSLRNPVFNGMFSNRMRESASEEVPLPDFSSSVLLSILEYLYTERVNFCVPVSWKMGFEVIRASHFFMVPAMESHIQKLFWQKVSAVPCWPRASIIEMLSQALEFDEDWKGKDSLLLNLTIGLNGIWYDEKDCSRRLSENAVDWILSKRKGSGSEKTEQPSVEEYYTFRQIVLWLVYQQVPTSNKEVTEKLQKALPIEKNGAALGDAIAQFPLNIDEITSVPSNPCDSHDPTAVLNARLGIIIPKESFQRLLNRIDWFQIPAILLLKVVYPLNVIPAHALTRALAVHALHRPVFRHDCRYEWKYCGKSLTCDAEGQVTWRSEDGSRNAWGRALPLLLMPRSHHTYEWKVNILQNEAEVIMLGIVYGNDIRPWESYDLGNRTLFSCSATRVLTIWCRRGVTYVCNSEPKPPRYEDWEKFSVEPAMNSPITFKLNPSEKTCQVSFGASFVTTWRDLPGPIFHPVFETYQANSVCLKIEKGSGFL